MDLPDRATLEELVDPRPLPPFARVANDLSAETLTDPTKRARAEFERLGLETLDPGATVAVGVGSRGIASIDEIVIGVVDALESRGFEPILVPAMGSHGGATPDGQRSVLESLGITPDRVGAPIDARMNVEKMADVDVDGLRAPVYFSRAALDADALLVINRIKPHTNFTGEIESGLCKMLAVGLGKQPGANAFHSAAIDRGYVATIEAFVEAIRKSVPVLGGLAIVENAREEVSHLEAVPASELFERELPLLERAYDEMPTLPVDDLDLLVVDEIGKEISGAGMDTNVIGRYRVLNAPDPDRPAIDLIYVRGLTAKTKGNGMGIGLADLTRRAAVDELDLRSVYTNAVTSGSLAKATLPLVAPDDELAIQIALNALGAYDPETARIAWIKNTSELETLRVSEAVADELELEITAYERLTFADGTASFEEIVD